MTLLYWGFWKWSCFLILRFRTGVFVKLGVWLVWANCMSTLPFLSVVSPPCTVGHTEHTGICGTNCSSSDRRSYCRYMEWLVKVFGQWLVDVLFDQVVFVRSVSKKGVHTVCPTSFAIFDGKIVWTYFLSTGDQPLVSPFSGQFVRQYNRPMVIVSGLNHTMVQPWVVQTTRYRINTTSINFIKGRGTQY